MVVGEMPEGLDFLVIGAGPGGYTAALEAAARGRTVTLVDRAGDAGVGGTCLLEGCIPSKALIEVADLRHRTMTFANAALASGGFDVDYKSFQEWKDSVVLRLANGVRSQLKAAGVDVVAGSFTFTGAHRGVIELGADAPPTHVEFESAVVAVGSAAVQIPPLPFDGDKVVDAAGLLRSTELPGRLAVVGGGYVGIEIGTALQKLGTEVVVVEAEGSILPGMPAAARKHVARRASKLGMELLTGFSAQGTTDDGIVVADELGTTRSVPADKVLVAVGRRPATRDLGLATAGVQLDEAGLIPVGADGLAAPRIAAIGDVVAGPALAHKAIAEAKVAVDALCGGPAQMVSTVIPLVVFSDPEVATVGLSQEDAAEEGLSTELRRLPMGASGRAATMEATDGVTELVVDVESNAIVGGILVGPHVSELIGELTLAVEMGATPEDVALTIHPHPTVSEMLQDVAGLYSTTTDQR